MEFIEGTEQRTRKGIRGQIYIKSRTGKEKKQWVIAPYDDGDQYEPPNPPVVRDLPATPTPTEALPDTPEQIKALSVRQPYAEMIITGEKKTEYRTKNTNVRGRVYIYASATKYKKIDTLDIADQVGIPADEINQLPRKVVIGSVEIFDSREREAGGYEWLLENPIRFSHARPPNPDQRANPVWFFPFGNPDD
jgi:hypothetical protein